jgi:hypothetical protein
MNESKIGGARVKKILGLATVALFAGIASAGCGPAVQNITVATPGTVAAVPDQATIVIVQPTTHFQSVGILDARGQLIAQLNDRSHTVIQVPAGPVRLYALVENKAGWADRLEGTVVAGKIYYATVGLRWGGVAFLALNMRSPDARWAQKDAYVASTPRVQMDLQKVSLAAGQIGDPAAVFKSADAFNEKLDPPHRAERLIQAEDGI